MMIKIKISEAQVAFLITFALLSGVIVAALPEGVEFPIAELGNCASEEECRAYCDAPENKVACITFAEKYKVDERASKLAGVQFPVAELGNCGSVSECETYCSEPDNFELCIEFGEKNGFIDSATAEEDKKMAGLVAQGKTPGGCKTESECKAYCKDDSRFNECLKFLEENNIVSEDDLEMIKKFGTFNFEGPGGCTDETSCKEYCKVDSHFNECVKFLETSGLLPSEELEMIKKMGSFRGPGGCLMDECEDYCENPDNFNTCIDFAKERGFISDEEYQIVKKTGGKGPGGCKREECRTYCDNPDNMQVCVEFACENGIMSESECSEVKELLARGVKIGGPGPGNCKGKAECESYCKDSSHGEECFKFACERGFATPEQCARGIGGGPGGFGQEFAGPGNCKSEEECKAYCSDKSHQEECSKFGPGPGGSGEQGFPGGEFAGPGGCRSEEECKNYCSDPAHSAECGGFGPGSGGSSGPGPGSFGEGFPGGQQGFPSGGPGGCRTSEECQAFCSNPANAQQCGASGGGPTGPQPTERLPQEPTHETPPTEQTYPTPQQQYQTPTPPPEQTYQTPAQ